MVILVIHHQVKDFSIWKSVFDSNEELRRKHGIIEHRIYQDIYDPNRVVIHNDFPSEEAAKKYREDPSLTAMLHQAGVAGEPGFGFINRLEQKTY